MKQQIWQGLEQLNNDPEFLQHKRNEFREDLPLTGGISADAQTSRRDFLKILGFSVTAATIAASCEIPVRRAIPYVFKPEEISPGIANYYASSFVDGSDYCSVLVKTREGRPIKIEGNNLSGITQGGTSARAQASIISLYDTARLRYPKKEGKKTTWKDIDAEIGSKLAGTNGTIALVTGSILSPSTRQAIAEFKNKYSNAKHIVYDPVSKAGILNANERNFGKRVVPSYRFDRAKTIVSFGADFLGTWVSPIEFTKQYSSSRKVSRENPTMSKHWHFESIMSLTGANADKRFTLLPSQEGIAVVALYNELAGMLGKSALANAALKDAEAQKAIKQVALELKSSMGTSLIVSGSNDANVQVVVNAINGMLGNYGNTLSLDRVYAHQSDDKAMAELVAGMGNGSVGAVILYHVNPAYSYPEAGKFMDGLKKVPVSVSFNDREDETSVGVKYLCPDNHYLESWCDAEAKTGFYSLSQPAISPLFDTRQAPESLLTWAGNRTTFYDYVRAYWQNNVFGKQSKFGNFKGFWEAALHDGIFEIDNPNKTNGTDIMRGEYAPTTATTDTTSIVAMATAATETIAWAPTVSVINIDAQGASGSIMQAISAAKGIELTVFENVVMGDGRYANNPFLQETPEPISKVCWDNVLSVSPKYGKEQGWEEYDVVEVKVGGYAIQLPVVFQPGQAYGSCSIALGYGRTKAGSDKCHVGKNAFPFASFNGETFDYVKSGVTLQKVGGRYEGVGGYGLARTQTHSTIDDERFIVGLASLESYKKDKFAGNHYSLEWDEKAKEGEFFTLYGNDNLYGPHADAFNRGQRWGMAIDLSSCTGCGACVPACHIENNVPVVGQEEVARVHEMHWMRIDRYYLGKDMENPEVAFMPMMCQHCASAPCENVCPVAATNHSGEGLNQMAYNRCIGTRYCANNCPYKVRRFNWFDYQGSDSFYKDTIFDNDEWTTADELSRMVLNPDVTVRSRGVMEKCSMCVQRIQEGKLAAKRENRQMRDGDVKSACQAACPANAIVFGNLNSPTSEVSKLHSNERNYYLLEELHVVPGIGYQTRIKNREALAGIDSYSGDGTAHEKTEEKHEAAPAENGHGG